MVSLQQVGMGYWVSVTSTPLITLGGEDGYQGVDFIMDFFFLSLIFTLSEILVMYPRSLQPWSFISR